MRGLLDGNALIALLDAAHIHHEPAHADNLVTLE